MKNLNHTECYRENYPRPQFVRDNFRLLCGLWDFAFDDDREGERCGWYRRLPAERKILVPYAYQSAKSGIGSAEVHECVWYAAEFLYDPEELAGKRLLLHFEGCDYLTKVWVNGAYMGSHRGGYCRFSFDITEAVLAGGGKAYIAVRAEDTQEAFQPRGKQSSLGRSSGCWYCNTTGIWKPVWTETVSQYRLQGVKITPSARGLSVAFEAALHAFEPDMRLKVAVRYGGELVAETEALFTRRVIDVKLDLCSDGDLFRVRYWSPEAPNLYDVKLTLTKDGKVTDEVGTYFGLADCRAQGNCLMLNHNPVYLKMALMQGYFREGGLTPPDGEAFAADILLAKSFGFNGIRMHQKIEDERFYYYADILGMAVWCEMPSAYEFKSETPEKVAGEWFEAVRQNYNHPSILAWVPLNESWGVPHILTDSSQQALSLALYYGTKAYDAHRPVIGNDGWEHTVSDIVTLHNYAQSAEELERFYGDLKGALGGENRPDYSQTRLPFAQGFSYGGQPVIVSEFAGIGYQSGADGGWGYGEKVRSAEEFVERLASLVHAIRKIDGICGFCVTQLTDVEEEINGLADIDRIPKAPIAAIRKAVEGV